jgi:hypothetical protein
VATRCKGEVNTGTNHLGFRCVTDFGLPGPATERLGMFFLRYFDVEPRIVPLKMATTALPLSILTSM